MRFPFGLSDVTGQSINAALGVQTRRLFVKIYIDPYQDLTDEEYQIVRDGGACPRCAAAGYNRRIRGTVTGIVALYRQSKCPCKFAKFFVSVWYDLKFVPERFRSVTLDSLVPVGAPTSKLPVEMQAKVITGLQANPDSSYLLCGDAGTGKTHFSSALFHRAVREWARKAFEEEAMWERSVFRFNTKAILDQQVAWATKENGDNTKEPDLTPNRIRKLAGKGHKVCLFFDELDKFNPTKFKMDCLFELVDAIYETKGQVVAVGNATVPKLQKVWADYDSCDAIIRRIRGEEADGKQIEFKAGK
jgi:hypothetical protein